ncbi:hypothetical protein C8Q79DRAFT_341528 [Trametes meyenii]|nr:hypothetical protein C8Q79DRAFT_341528 [Trametes meyenii]
MVVTCGAWSDRLKRRSPFILLGLVLCLIGFIISLSASRLGLKYFGTFLIVIGGYAGFPAVPSWLGNNLVGHYKRGTGMAIQAVSGQVGGIIASNIYIAQDGPRYVLGHSVELAFVCVGLVFVPSTALVYARLNSRRDAAAQKERAEQEDGPTGAVWQESGDRAPQFRYTL